MMNLKVFGRKWPWPNSRFFPGILEGLAQTGPIIEPGTSGIRSGMLTALPRRSAVFYLFIYLFNDTSTA
jgi:hypothetical protein